MKWRTDAPVLIGEAKAALSGLPKEVNGDNLGTRLSTALTINQ